MRTFLQRSLLPSLVVLIFATTTAEAHLLRCLTSLSRFFAPPVPNPRGFFDVNPAPELRERLRAMANQIRRERAEQLAATRSRRPAVGATIVHAGARYTVEQVLGARSEGIVYVVRDEAGGRHVIKIFFDRENNNPRSINDYAQTLRERAQEVGVRYPRIQSYDYGNQSMLMEYVNGVPLDTVLERGLSYGLTASDIVLVRTYYDAHSRGEGENMVLDLESGFVYQIDPF